MAVTESLGTWGAPVTVALPPGDVTGGLNDVSCPSVGDCVAVGYAVSTLGATQPLIVSEVSGTWGTPIIAAPPPGAPTGAQELAEHSGVACSSVGNCTAVGSYRGADSNGHPMVEVESSGSWGATLSLPAATGSSQLPRVSCTSPGNCTVVAETNSWTETAGTWGTPTLIAPSPGTPYSVFFAADVACPSATTCIAVGHVSSDRNWQPAVVTATSGTWGSLSLLSTPILSPDTGVSGLGAISCQATVCVAVGSASNDFGPNQQDYPIAVTWSSGRGVRWDWRTSTRLERARETDRSPLPWRAPQRHSASPSVLPASTRGQGGHSGCMSTRRSSRPCDRSSRPVLLLPSGRCRHLVVQGSRPRHLKTTEACRSRRLPRPPLPAVNRAPLHLMSATSQGS